MPKFLVTVTAITLFSFSGLLYLIFFTSPSSKTGLVAFFVLLLLFLSHLISIPVYYRLYKKAPRMSELKPLYRQAFKVAFFLSSFIVVIGILRVFHAFNALNLLLLCILYFSIYKFAGKRDPGI